MNHTEFITKLAEIYRPNVYLELGLYRGETISAVAGLCGKSIGVDIVPVSLPIGCEFHQLTTDQFFEKFDGYLDMVFIDADHSYESVKRDFENSLAILNPGGVIILHDTDPEIDSLIHPGYCGDCYKFIRELEYDLRVNVLTLPILEPGLSIVTLKNDTRAFRRGL